MAKKKPRVVKVKKKPTVKEQTDWSLLLAKEKEGKQPVLPESPEGLKKAREQQWRNAYPEAPEPGTPVQLSRKKKKSLSDWLLGR